MDDQLAPWSISIALETGLGVQAAKLLELVSMM